MTTLLLIALLTLIIKAYMHADSFFEYEYMTEYRLNKLRWRLNYQILSGPKYRYAR